MRERRLLVALLLACGAVLFAACDPCSGVESCTTAPHVTVQGRIVDVGSGAGVVNARVSLIRTSPGPRDSVSTTTDDQGNFQTSLASGAGTFDILVAPPNLPSYRVRDTALASSTNRGEANVLGLWIATPIFGTQAELFYRTTQQLVQGAAVTFTRTAGADLPGGGVYSAGVTDAAGRAALLNGVTASGLEDVVGDLTVQFSNAFGTSVVHGVRLKPSYQFRPRDVLRLAVGPQMSWMARIYDRARVRGVPGVTVTFTRTGGIATIPTSFTAVTDSAGNFFIPLVPLAQGDVVGDLTVQPPPPYRGYTNSAVHIPTFDADGIHFLPGWGVGPHLPWSGVFSCNGKPAANVAIYVRQVGGIAVTPTTLYLVTDANGIFNMSGFKPSEYGDLIVDFQSFTPADSPCVGFVLHNLHLPTLDFDTDNRFIDAWDLPKR